jgi:hypothetical protein
VILVAGKMAEMYFPSILKFSDFSSNISMPSYIPYILQKRHLSDYSYLEYMVDKNKRAHTVTHIITPMCQGPSAGR